MSAQSVDAVVVPDSLVTDTVPVKLSFFQKGIFGKIIRYFEKSNEYHPEKRFDIGFLGGPHYSSDTGFGIGLMAVGTYHMNPNDTALATRSTVSLYGDATTNCFFTIGIRGLNIFPKATRRLEYNLDFNYTDTYFWGIGFEQDKLDSNKTQFKYLQGNFDASLLWRLTNGLYVGPEISFSYVYGYGFPQTSQWASLPDKNAATGFGIRAVYDTRDYPGNAFKGMYICFSQRYNFHTIPFSHAFGLTTFSASFYNQVWKGGVIATRFNTVATYGDTPWALLPQLGGNMSMRGYYLGRYRNKCLAEATVELRQHVWRRNGLALWLGAAEVYDKPADMRWRMILPNYGIGYRWEFKHRMNLRLDLGFGRDGAGFIFSIDEAF